MISGAFSVTHQAVQLGFLPRLRTEHTSEKAAGQIYIPAVNWGLLAMVILLVLGFRESGRLASAYGIAVTGTMLITTIMLGVLVFQVWHWNRLLATATIGLFLLVDGTYFASNITKIPDGGWFPLLVAAVSFTVLTTWAKGRAADARAARRESALAAAGVHQVGGRVGPPRARHVGVPVGLGRQRARGAAPQPQAQPGASRARDHPQREGRGSAARRRRRSGSRSTTPARASTA